MAWSILKIKKSQKALFYPNHEITRKFVNLLSWYREILVKKNVNFSDPWLPFRKLFTTPHTGLSPMGRARSPPLLQIIHVTPQTFKVLEMHLIPYNHLSHLREIFIWCISIIFVNKMNNQRYLSPPPSAQMIIFMMGLNPPFDEKCTWIYLINKIYLF